MLRQPSPPRRELRVDPAPARPRRSRGSRRGHGLPDGRARAARAGLDGAARAPRSSAPCSCARPPAAGSRSSRSSAGSRRRRRSRTALGRAGAAQVAERRAGGRAQGGGRARRGARRRGRARGRAEREPDRRRASRGRAGSRPRRCGASTAPSGTATRSSPTCSSELEAAYDSWLGGGLTALHAEIVSRDALAGRAVTRRRAERPRARNRRRRAARARFRPGRERRSHARVIDLRAMRYTFIGTASSPNHQAFADELSAALQRTGFERAPDGENDVDLVINVADYETARPFRRKSKGTYVAALHELDETPETLEDGLAASYPMLVRALANIVLALTPGPRRPLHHDGARQLRGRGADERRAGRPRRRAPEAARALAPRDRQRVPARPRARAVGRRRAHRRARRGRRAPRHARTSSRARSRSRTS